MTITESKPRHAFNLLPKRNESGQCGHPNWIKTGGNLQMISNILRRFISYTCQHEAELNIQRHLSLPFFSTQKGKQLSQQRETFDLF